MKKAPTILFLVFIFNLMALTAHAQAYEYEFSYDGDILECITDDSYTMSNGKDIIMMSLSTMKECHCVIGFATSYDDILNICNTVDPENFTVQLKLTNGDVLRSTKGDGDVFLIDFWWYFSPVSMSISNIIRENNFYHVMSLLRTYDIVSITIEGITIKTPGLRSADTFDAMCKTLAFYTGDQGQYGKRLVGGKNKNSKNTNNKNTNNKTPKIEKFNSTNPTISISQFVRYPFGLASLDKEGLSEQEFFNEMRDKLPEMKETASTIISHYYDYGKESDIRLAYKGKDMNLSAAYFDDGNGNPLRQYIYTFTFEKSIYQKEDIIQFVNHILSDLNSDGINMDINGSVEDFRDIKGKINGNDILLSSSEGSTYDYEVRIIVTKPFLRRRK